MSEEVKTDTNTQNFYVQNEQSEWVIDPEFDKKASALYYSGRLFYEPNEHRFPTGRYTADGQVVRFNQWYTDNAPAAA